MSDVVIEATGSRESYRAVKALDGIDLRVEPGRILDRVSRCGRFRRWRRHAPPIPRRQLNRASRDE